jgi:hypothetical protein
MATNATDIMRIIAGRVRLGGLRPAVSRARFGRASIRRIEPAAPPDGAHAPVKEDHEEPRREEGGQGAFSGPGGTC